MLIILDSDGVINQESADHIRTPEQWIALPGSLEAIAWLNEAGHQVAVASNKSGIARGYYSEAMLARIIAKMHVELKKVNGKIDGFYYCPHHPNDQCHCRKPKPGLLFDIANDLQQPINEAIFIGDKISDIHAAQAAGCQALLVKTGYGEQTLAQYPMECAQIAVFKHLYEAVKSIG